MFMLFMAFRGKAKIRLKDIPKNLDLETSLDLGAADADTEAVL